MLTCHQSSLMEKKPFGEQASGKPFYDIHFFQVHPLILSRSPADVSVSLAYRCWDFNLIKLSLKIAVYMIAPTSKRLHAMDRMSKSLGVSAGADGVLHLRCSSPKCFDVSSSRNGLGLAVVNSDALINPGHTQRKWNKLSELGDGLNWQPSQPCI